MSTCHFCGDDTPCECTVECAVCGHIGHEHYADGRCRGAVYDVSVLYQEICAPHEYQPKLSHPPEKLVP